MNIYPRQSIRAVFENKGANTRLSNSGNIHGTQPLCRPAGFLECLSWTQQPQLPERPPAEPDPDRHCHTWSGVRISICP